EVLRDLDPEDPELALVVELDHGVAGRTRRLLVRGEESILERADECVLLDALLTLDCTNVFDDLDAHFHYPFSIRLPRTISSYGTSSEPVPVPLVTARSPAATSSPRKRVLPPISWPVLTTTALPRARAKWAGLRSGRSGPGDETSIANWLRHGSSSCV